MENEWKIVKRRMLAAIASDNISYQQGVAPARKGANGTNERMATDSVVRQSAGKRVIAYRIRSHSLSASSSVLEVSPLVLIFHLICVKFF